MTARLLIYAPVPVHKSQDGTLYGERQAVSGLHLWATHFDHVTVMMPLSPDPVPEGWVPISDLLDSSARITVEVLPMAYRPDQFLRELGATRRRISDLVRTHDYLSFAIGGLFGDWGTVGATEARKQGRKYAVWTDRVESEVMRAGIGKGTWRQNLRARLYHRPMAWQERRVIRQAALGLFHGRETFDAYSSYCQNSQIVHDIHIAPDAHISEAEFDRKQEAAKTGPLNILYVGRADPMKGPDDWLDVLEGLRNAGVLFMATWLGDGSEIEAMRSRVANSDLKNCVNLQGFVDDRSEVRSAMVAASVFLFCHLTPESPRNLIEALSTATPLAGYDGAYARDLISGHGGGWLSARGDITALVNRLVALDQDRPELIAAMDRARQDGKPFNDVDVFRHRSDLIKRHL